MSRFFTSRLSENEESWISVSDLMAGLMMVFLFLAIIYSQDADQRAQNVTEIVSEWQDSELAIYTALQREFEDDLPKWNAAIEKETLTIRFASPEVLFKTGSAELEDRFREILSDFIPRYVKLLTDRFTDQIAEVRIEGHTSSEWQGSADKTEAFIRNMELSQERTRAVLNYSLGLTSVSGVRPWMRKTVSANGLSSARLIQIDGMEDEKRSRRVEFAIRTKAKEALFRILDRVAPAVEKKI